MQIITSVNDMKKMSHTLRKSGRSIGFVPTMGALHRGHISLVEIAQQHADVVALSIFVNPTQFGPTEDYSEYPRPFSDDCAAAEAAGCDLLFTPTVAEMYPPNHQTVVSVAGITEQLCGASRPGHFSGVTTVVNKYFNIIQPAVAVFGQKDAQQVIVIERMVRDLFMSTSIVVAPIVREADGLALSSRNRYLTHKEREAAPLIFKGLIAAQERFAQGELGAEALAAKIREVFAASALLAPEYIAIVDRETLRPCATVTAGVLMVVACRMKESATRLIDNCILGA